MLLQDLPCIICFLIQYYLQEKSNLQTWMQLIGQVNGAPAERTHEWCGQKDIQSFLRGLRINCPTEIGNKSTQSKHLLRSINAKWVKGRCVTQLRLLSQVIMNNISYFLWRSGHTAMLEILRLYWQCDKWNYFFHALAINVYH